MQVRPVPLNLLIMNSMNALILVSYFRENYSPQTFWTFDFIVHAEGTILTNAMFIIRKLCLCYIILLGDK
jgi:hypothetical protein